MNILFLDFDGVLNSKQHILALKEQQVPGKDTTNEADLEFMKANVNPNNMWCLKYILNNVSDLKIVISSSWRHHFDIEQFKELFKHYGLDGERIIDKTPKKFSSERIHEIHMWVDEVNEPEYDEQDNVIPKEKIEVDWIALDDHPIFHLEDPDKQREILTNQWVGLTMEEAFKIVLHFKPDFKEPWIAI